MKIAYFDCSSGISGNMVMGSLLDAGLDVEQLETQLAKLQLPGYRLDIQKVKRRGLTGTHVEVEVSDTETHRHLSHIEKIINESGLSQSAKARSVSIFRRLAEAEAEVHGISSEKVHFHEVGAVDAIIDIVGASVGLELLGIDRVYASPVHIGRGTVECAHGILPVPAPATQELLRGVPVYGRDVDAELVTPTGAAILTSLVDEFGSAPPMRVEAVGYGAGTRDLTIPNLLRLSIGSGTLGPDAYEADRVMMVEANIDDMNPELYEYTMDRLFEAGALDVFLTPIHMKRNRPAVQLSLMSPEERVSQLVDLLFEETTSIGVRAYPVQRWKLTREQVTVETEYGPVSVKVSRRGDTVLNVAPEYQACRQVAEEHNVPLKAAYEAARQAAFSHIDGQ